METHSCQRDLSEGCSLHCCRWLAPSAGGYAGYWHRWGLLPWEPHVISLQACCRCPRILQQENRPLFSLIIMLFMLSHPMFHREVPLVHSWENHSFRCPSIKSLLWPSYPAVLWLGYSPLLPVKTGPASPGWWTTGRLGALSRPSAHLTQAGVGQGRSRGTTPATEASSASSFPLRRTEIKITEQKNKEPYCHCPFFKCR